MERVHLRDIVAGAYKISNRNQGVNGSTASNR